MNPNRLQQRAKHFRSLYKEERILSEQKRNTPPVKLDEPFQRGYERFFVLTNEAKRQRNANQLEQALNYFQNYQYCRKGFFQHYCTPRRNQNHIRKHHLLHPHLTQIIKKGIPRRLLPFIKSKTINLDKGLPTIRQLERRQLGERVTFRYPHLVTSHTQPRIITHLPLHDPALEARLHELATTLWQTGPQGEISKALHRRNWRHCERSKSDKSSREDFFNQLQEANHDPTIKSAISPRFFSALIPFLIHILRRSQRLQLTPPSTKSQST